MLRSIGAANGSMPAVVFLGAALFALLPISTDLYLPALPALRNDLGIIDAWSQLTLSAFVIGFGFGQIAYGPLSDRFGRRPVLLAGLVLYTASGIACMLAPVVEVLVAARLIQGFGACSGMVLTRAIIRDLYEPQQGARVLSWISLLFVFVPLLAPVVGGYITVWFGWRANFAVLVVCGLGMLASVWVLLAETNRHRDPSATDLRRMAANAAMIWKNRTFAGFAIAYMFSYSGLFCYLSASAFVLVDAFGVRPDRFGFWLMIGVAGVISGSWSATRLTARIPLPRLLMVGAVFCSGGALAMLLLALAGVMHPLAVVGPMAVYLIGHGINTPVCMSAAVGPFLKLAGTASALLGFAQFALAAVAGQIVTRVQDGTAVPLALAVTLCAAGILVVGKAVERQK
jgi:DHA1 family bicyclomycin/chloramphenicol resistance-like MFS transporter